MPFESGDFLIDPSSKTAEVHEVGKSVEASTDIPVGTIFSFAGSESLGQCLVTLIALIFSEDLRPAEIS